MPVDVTDICQQFVVFGSNHVTTKHHLTIYWIQLVTKLQMTWNIH